MSHDRCIVGDRIHCRRCCYRVQRRDAIKTPPPPVVVVYQRYARINKPADCRFASSARATRHPRLANCGSRARDLRDREFTPPRKRKTSRNCPKRLDLLRVHARTTRPLVHKSSHTLAPRVARRDKIADGIPFQIPARIMDRPEDAGPGVTCLN